MNPGTVLGPVPAVLVSSGRVEGPRNIITLAWAGTVNSEPPMLVLGVRKSRQSYQLIRDSQELVVNLARHDQAHILDYCGHASGKKVDKFERLGLTPLPGELVKAPLVAECPVNIECLVRQELSLPSHQVFVCEVVKVWADEGVLAEGGISPTLSSPVCYYGGHYWSLGQDLGKMGALFKKV